MSQIFSPADLRSAAVNGAAPPRERDRTANATSEGTDFAHTLQTQIEQRRDKGPAAAGERPRVEEAPRRAEARTEEAARRPPAEGRTEQPRPAEHRAESDAPQDPACRPGCESGRSGEPAANAGAASDADPGKAMAAWIAAPTLEIEISDTLPKPARPAAAPKVASIDPTTDGTDPLAAASAASVAVLMQSGAIQTDQPPPPADGADEAVNADGFAATRSTIDALLGDAARSRATPTVDTTDGSKAAISPAGSKAGGPEVADLRAGGGEERPVSPTAVRADLPFAKVAEAALAQGRSPLVPAEQSTESAPAANPIAAAPVNRATVAGAPSPTALVATSAGSAGFAEEVGQKVVMFAGRGESKAELVLTPPHLGRVEVTLTVTGDQTTAQFVAASTAARDALEQALPRLREMLAQSGITLGDSSVNTQSRGEGQEGRQTGYRGGFGGGPQEAGPATSGRWVRASNGLIDTFA